MTVYVDQYFTTLFGIQTHFQSTQTSVAHPTYVLCPAGCEPMDQTLFAWSEQAKLNAKVVQIFQLHAQSK